MKKMIFALVLCLVLSVAAAGQTSIGTPDPPSQQPQFILLAGLGFNHYDTPQFKGELSFATRVADRTYNVSTLNMTSKVSTITTGVARQFYSGQGFTMSAIADAGVATGNGNVGGAISGGGVLTCDLSKLSKVPGSFAYGAVKVAQSSLGGVQPTFSFGFGKSF
jgi:hypothetical protein